MKKIIYTTILAAVLTFVSSNMHAQNVTADSVTMGPGYANEIYYSAANGSVFSGPRNTWDIAFRTNIMSSGILTNDGAGVVLYTYPVSDTAGWASVDTAGLSGWTPMYNDPDEWENGAFSRNATGHPDYGWGIYNEQTHNLTGDSIFIIKLRDGSFKKLWIEMKKSAADIYEFRFANLDGSDEQNVSLSLVGHLDVEFYGYDITGNQEVNFQPARESWDILFTRYIGINEGQPYPVVGVLSNNYLRVKEFSGVPQSYNEWWNGSWDTTRSVIGYDWKLFTGTAYEVDDSLVYFIADNAGDIYKIYFTKFEGSSTGKIVFNIGKISNLGVGDATGSAALTLRLSPNPVSDRLKINYDSKNNDIITVVNISGQIVLKVTPGEGVTSVDVSSLPTGIYFVSVTTSDNKSIAKKFIISR